MKADFCSSDSVVKNKDKIKADFSDSDSVIKNEDESQCSQVLEANDYKMVLDEKIKSMPDIVHPTTMLTSSNFIQ